jgi:hypothetical protein
MDRNGIAIGKLSLISGATGPSSAVSIPAKRVNSYPFSSLLLKLGLARLDR